MWYGLYNVKSCGKEDTVSNLLHIFKNLLVGNLKSEAQSSRNRADLLVQSSYRNKKKMWNVFKVNCKNTRMNLLIWNIICVFF